MKRNRILAVFLTVVMLITALSTGLSAAALMMVETQYTYDSANLSWLKDLIIKEDMSSVNGLSSSCTLEPVAKYPYRETAESFKEEIAYYQMMYTLDENMVDVIYLYMLDLVESMASTTTSDYTDEFIKSYLESLGVVYPSGEAENSTETYIVARALFSILNSDEDYEVKRGTGLYDAFTGYISKLLGVNVSVILKFDGNNDFSDMEEFVLAVCKYMLYVAGYDVSAVTSDSEVYRLIAIMTIRSQGISIDSSTATFEEIKIKYLCAMMCKIYDVSIDVNAFEKAVNADNLAFYMLQLAGKKSGVAIKDSVPYKDAFDLVCKNTDYFNLIPGEFYADIYEYNIQLKYLRSTVWIYPQTLGTTSESEGTSVKVKINDAVVRENYYVDIALDKSKSTQSVLITVEYTDKSGTKSSSYKINIRQGTEEPVQSSIISSALTDVSDIVNKLLGEVGLDSSLATIVRNIPFELPDRIFSISSLLMPSFDSNSLGSSFLQALFGYSTDNDKNTNTDQLGGVGGLDSFNSGNSSDSVQSMDFNVNVDYLNSLQPDPNVQDKPIYQANQVVIDDNQANYPQDDVVDDSNWLESFMSDTGSVVILAVVLLVVFAGCLVLFMKLLKPNGENKEKKDKK
ncbi:MAG: cadherin-like beta sandwich domain-containing protein [Clostridia bacterium]|nr:cadherin-like beta sandwich domain-containing protein [Clostridia bacterium]